MLIKKLHKDAVILTRAHFTDAGLDLYACMDITIPVFGRTIVYTGIAIEIETPGWFGLITVRSGLATQHGIILNSSGVIDPDYRGEILVGLINVGELSYQIKKGDRFAQLMCLPYLCEPIKEVEELSNTERGDKGHGSTGK